MVYHSKWRRRCWFAIAVAVFFAVLTGIFGSLAFGEIVAPVTSLEHHPIPVSISGDTIPTTGRVIRLGPGWIIPDGLNVDHVSPTRLSVCGAPRTEPYVIRYQITWIHLEEFLDGEGKTRWGYVAHGESNDTHTLTITGDSGPPDPPKPPDPNPADQKHLIMIFYRANLLDNMTRDQRTILTSLSLRQRLKADGHRVVEILDYDAFSAGSIPERYEPWFRAVKDDPMPRICLAPIEGGVIRDYPLPANQEKLWELLNR